MPWHTQPPRDVKRCDFTGHARMRAKMVRAVTWGEQWGEARKSRRTFGVSIVMGVPEMDGLEWKILFKRIWGYLHFGRLRFQLLKSVIPCLRFHYKWWKMWRIFLNDMFLFNISFQTWDWRIPKASTILSHIPAPRSRRRCRGYAGGITSFLWQNGGL